MSTIHVSYQRDISSDAVNMEKLWTMKVFSQQTFLVFPYVFKMSWRRLQHNNFSSSKTSWRHFQDFFKTSSKTCLQDVFFKLSSRPLEDLLYIIINNNNFLYSRIKETNIWNHLQCTNIYTIDYKHENKT